MSIEQYTQTYIALRDKEAEIAKRHAEELAPLAAAKQAIEMYLLDQMNQLGVSQFKTSAGTSFKKNAASVKMADPEAFKDFIFNPVIEGLHNYLEATGHSIQQADLEAMKELLRSAPKWDMVDFRAGKKGIMENLEQTSVLPPGVSIENFTTINVRRS